MSTALSSSGSSTTIVKVARRHGGEQSTTLPAMTVQRPGDGGPGQATMLYQPSGMTVMQLVRAYWDHVTIYYRSLDGRQTNEVDGIRQALKPLVRLFEHLPADLLGPKRLKLVRDELIALGLCRRTVNQQTGRIKRMYKWGVENELVSPSTYHGLQAVGGLKMGRTQAPEGEPVKPVQSELIEGVLQHVSRQVGAMIRLQLLTGMRPGELVIMRTCDIDRNDEVWVYRPSRHKTQHHCHSRTVFLGPQAKEIVKPYINELCPERYLFSAAEADKERRSEMGKRRKTPMDQGNVPGRNKKRRPKRTPGDRYRTDSYRKAITYANKKAFPTPPGLAAEAAKAWRREHHWHPHQLRHNAATRLRKEFGIDAAQVILGHKTLAVTEVYAERDTETATRIMKQVG